MKRPHRVPALEASITASLLIAACSLTVPSEGELFMSEGSGGNSSGGSTAGGDGRGGSDPAGGTNNTTAGGGGRVPVASGGAGGGGGEPSDGGLGGTPTSGGTPGVGGSAGEGLGGTDDGPVGGAGGEGGESPVFVPFDPTDGLILHYKFDETEGTTAYDEYSEEFDATIHGTSTWTDAGKIGGALKMSGETGNYVDIPPQFLDTLTDMTVSIWFYQEVRPLWARVFDFGSNSTHWFYFAPATVLAGQQGSRAALDVSNAIVAELHMIEHLPPIKQWVHVAIAWNQLEFSCYLDGKLATNKTVVPPYSLFSPSEFSAMNPGPEGMRAWLGKSSFDPDPAFTGMFDDMRIYDRVLTESDVAQLHALSE